MQSTPLGARVVWHAMSRVNTTQVVANSLRNRTLQLERFCALVLLWRSFELLPRELSVAHCFQYYYLAEALAAWVNRQSDKNWMRAPKPDPPSGKTRQGKKPRKQWPAKMWFWSIKKDEKPCVLLLLNWISTREESVSSRRRRRFLPSVKELSTGCGETRESKVRAAFSVVRPK